MRRAILSRTLQFLLFALLAFPLWAEEDPWFGKPPTLDDVRNAKRVSIVFAGENLRSPVSMFGHTFLVFHNAPEPEPDAPVIEYLAKAPEGFWETLKGGFGTLPGNLHLSRFAYKKREYDLEDRDLWIFQLSDNKVKRAEIAKRFQESLGKTERYNFFRSNCAFHVLKLLVGESSEVFSGVSLYTIPIETVQTLERQGWIESVSFSPSSSTALNETAVRLSPEERALVARLLKGYSLDPKKVPSKGSDLAETINRGVDFRSPREPKADLRAHLWELKKRFPAQSEPALRATPATQRRIGYLQVALAPTESFFILTLRPAFQDFYSVLPGPMDFSTLDLMRVQLGTNLQTVFLSEWNIFRMESLISPKFLAPGFVRYLDLSYHNWAFLYGGKNEMALNLGLGWSRRVFPGFQFAVVPYVGARIYDDSGLRPGGVLAVRSQVQLTFSERTRIKAIYELEPFSPVGFAHRVQVDMVPFETKTWGLLGSLSYAGTAASKLRFTLGATAFF